MVTHRSQSTKLLYARPG